jgi:uncharacterized protein YidB (DUF937 family)
MTALLGLLAVAGYQNRDKIAEWLGGSGQQPSPPPTGSRSTGMPQTGAPQTRAPQTGAPSGGQSGGLAGVLEQLRGSLAGSSPGGILSGGLAELIDRFRQNGQGETADSWVSTGPNQPVAPSQLERAIGPDVLATLSRQTGLSQQELLARLSRELPNAVDRYTPEGRIPSEAEFSRETSGPAEWRR